MKNIVLLLLSLSIVFGCTKDFEELNKDTKNPASVEAVQLFAGAQKQLADYLSNSGLNIGRMLVQHWTETTYTDFTNYNFGLRYTSGVWNGMYVDVLSQLNKTNELILLQSESLASAKVKQNQKACSEILSILGFSMIVDTWGDAPYSETFMPDLNYPKYDDAAAIYSALLTRLDVALNSITTSEPGFSSDLYYHGDMEAWKKFGNSLKLRLGMMIADVDAAKAKVVVEAAASNVFESNDDNALLAYLSSPPNNNPVWNDLVQSGRKDYVAGGPLVDALVERNDPRVGLYFSHDANDKYSGGLIGPNNNYTLFSKPGAKNEDPTTPGIIMDYTEVEFLLAEAVERKFNVGGTAQEHYNKAILASIAYWGGDETEGEEYLKSPKVDYASKDSGSEWREKIGIQKWIALYNRGWEAWTEWRRLDYPHLEPATEAIDNVIPTRLPYSSAEGSLNIKNYDAAVAKNGKDDISGKVFWDKK
jgi:hypothetical protein